MKHLLSTGLLVFATQLLVAQSATLDGTILPVRLNSSLNSRKVKDGETISARVAQDVPLSSGSKIHAGATVIGHVTEVKSGKPAQLSVRFDTLVISGRRISVTTHLRALAGMMAVEEAQIPQTGPDRGTSENAWNTEQVGGEVVYRGGGPVADGLRTVGEPVPNGVLVHVSAKPGTPCRSDVGSNDRLQALWVFSSDACGAYGFADLAITQARRGSLVGEFTLESERGNVNVRAGSGMLLRVDSTSLSSSAKGPS
jgi:hypothetical protein